MKAIIMAGGEGSRLRPVTCDCPKPMVLFLDRPIMEYAVNLLKAHGVSEVGVTLGYLPDRVKDYFGDGRDFGVNLSYFTEEKPLGTAGGVRVARDMLTETFCVLSGDGVTDIDLSRALEFHKSKGALATLVLKRVENPLEYGVVSLDKDSRVRGFFEKPSWGEVISDAVNTGIYILEPRVLDFIPDGPYDFARELFPRLLSAGEGVFGYILDGYWCDVGDVSAYLRSQYDALDGRIKLNIPERGRGAGIDKSAIIEAPSYIAPGAIIGAGARVGPYSVIGRGAVIGERASVKRCIIWGGARVMRDAQLRGAVVMNCARVMPDSQMFEESVLGERAILGERASLGQGVKVWPGKEISEGERAAGNVVWGSGIAHSFDGRSLRISSIEDASRAAQAVCAHLKAGRVLLSRASGAVAAAYSNAVTAGLMAQGARVIDMGVSAPPEARYILKLLGADAAVWVDEDELRVMDADGAALGKSARRSVNAIAMRGDFAAPFSGLIKPPAKLVGADMLYCGRFQALLGEYASRFAVYAQAEPVLTLAEQALGRAGIKCRVEWERELMELKDGEIGAWLDDTGESVRFSDARGEFSEAENEMLMAWLALEMGAERLAVPTGACRGVLELCREYETEVISCKNDEAEKNRAFMQTGQMDIYSDGIYAIACLARALERGLWKFSDVRDVLPKTNRVSRVVRVERAGKGRVIRALAEGNPDADIGDGVSIERNGGFVWVSPGGDKSECVVVGEANDMEIARELCDFYVSEVERLARNK